jgi:hypothetical protein
VIECLVNFYSKIFGHAKDELEISRSFTIRSFEVKENHYGGNFMVRLPKAQGK